MNEPPPIAPHSGRFKWLARFRILLRVAGVFTLTVFLLSAFPILWKIHQRWHKPAEPSDFTYILNHGNVCKATRILKIAHQEKRGANQFVELEVAPLSETALAPSDQDKTFEQGWMPFSALDPSVASLVRQACRYAHTAGMTWFPAETTVAAGSMSVNVWSASLKHGEMNRVDMILCDPRAGRLYSADIRIP